MAVPRNVHVFCPEPMDSVAVLDPLPAAALGRVFGRDHVVHVAIAPGRLGDRLAIEAVRCEGLRITGSAGEDNRMTGSSPGRKRTGPTGST